MHTASLSLNALLSCPRLVTTRDATAPVWREDGRWSRRGRDSDELRLPDPPTARPTEGHLPRGSQGHGAMAGGQVATGGDLGRCGFQPKPRGRRRDRKLSSVPLYFVGVVIL